MTFASADLLVGLAALPLLVVGYLRLNRRRATRAAVWSSPALMPNNERLAPRTLRRLPPLLFLLAIAFMLVGFARPERVSAHGTPGSPIVSLTFDVSGSMAADDVGATRIFVARRAALELVSNLPARFQVAVLAFSTKVRVLVPPTTNRQLVLSMIPRAVTPHGGTAIGDAVDEAVETIVAGATQRKAGDREPPGAVVLFSDGGQTVGGVPPGRAALSAFVDDVPIDSVSIGTAHGAVTQTLSRNGQSTRVRIPVPSVPSLMRSLASTTHGAFIDLSSISAPPTQLSQISESLHPYATTDRNHQSLSEATAVVALLLVAAGILVSGLALGRPL
jgi:Ca-activated chloride channel family protein